MTIEPPYRSAANKISIAKTTETCDRCRATKPGVRTVYHVGRRAGNANKNPEVSVPFCQAIRPPCDDGGTIATVLLGGQGEFSANPKNDGRRSWRWWHASQLATSQTLPESRFASYHAFVMNTPKTSGTHATPTRDLNNRRLPLVDGLGRVHDSLRISITDRCNIRCRYCMPAGDPGYMPRNDLLTYEEIHRLALLFVNRFGINDIRLTGGEPMVRRDCEKLIAMLAKIEALQDLSMTTNGMLLPERARSLREAGLKRLNISIDTLDEQTFFKITRRKGVEQVIKGIDAAIDAGFETIKLNALAIAGITEHQLVDLVEFALSRQVSLRFIEFMPLDADRAWTRGDVLSGETLLDILRGHFDSVDATDRPHPSQPAEAFLLHSGDRTIPIGIIRSVTRPFCGNCNRVRLTADGAVRNCLFANDETPLRDAMREDASDETIAGLIQSAIAAKKAGHGMDDPRFLPPDRAMHAIGG